MNRPRGLTPAGGALEALLQSQDLARALRPHMAKVHWAGVVGPQVAGVTQVEAVRPSAEDGRSVLVVRVKNSVWANELVLLKDDLLRRLNRALGGRVLADIHFKASGLARGKGAPPAAGPAPAPLPTPEELARIVLPAETHRRFQALIGGVQDEILRARLQRSLVRAAQMDAWKRQQGWIPCRGCETLIPPPVPLCPICSIVRVAC